MSVLLLYYFGYIQSEMPKRHTANIDTNSKLGLSVTILAWILSALWMIFNPSFEPLVALVVFSGAAAPPIWLRLRRLSQLDQPVQFRFATISHGPVTKGDAIEHEVIALERTGSSGSWTSTQELRHRVKNSNLDAVGEWSTFAIIEGHTASFSAEDLDNDGNPELIVRFHAGAHTHVLQIYAVGWDHRLSLIEGGELGSDLGDIRIQESNGGIGIFVANTNHENLEKPTAVLHVYRSGKHKVHSTKWTPRPDSQ